MRKRSTLSVHIMLMIVSTIMLIPFYWVLKTSLTGENIFAYPPALLPENPQPFFYVDVWYAIPFVRYLFNSVVVSVLVVIANVVLNATAGYALTREFPGKKLTVLLFLSCMMIPFQVTIIPAYLITAKLGILNSYIGMALPLMSTIVCIFIFKAAFEAIPKSLIDAARIDGVPEWMIVFRIIMPLTKPAIATNVILSFIWSWNSFLWPLVIVRDAEMQTLPLGLSRFLSVVEDTTGALYAFCVMVLVPGLLIFLLAQKEFITGLTSGATKG
ncbi:carbohydrate ABC transporter permease [Pararhizobium sp. IMCC21322]|uniref:carbohydrate ABC transporter permease n=1 Tax=Pararhizobium sp. IMCC21322 TaxID=3067903 RepID=UPI002741D993|nr:carbohydrate ABC transporter permease [Pararhizobium sp. IMCC21322]